MLFGEKYPDPVRMVSMGEFSRELCGGTHLDNTSDVQGFEIVAEEGVSAGVRRVVALTGEKAREQEQQTRDVLQQAAALLACDPSQVGAAVKQYSQQLRALKKQLGGGAAAAADTAGLPAIRPLLDYLHLKAELREAARALNVAPFETPQRIRGMLEEIAELKQQIAKLGQEGDISADRLIQEAERIDDVPVVIHQLPAGNPNLMRQLIDQIRQKTSPVAVLLAAVQGDKVQLVAGVSKELLPRGVHAGNWVGHAASVVGGGGGGRPDMAQAGGKDPRQLPAALDAARTKMAEMLG
jgi:alanyl-tRNA synthetase